MAIDKKIASIAASKLGSKNVDETTKSLAGYILALYRHENK